MRISTQNNEEPEIVHCTTNKLTSLNISSTMKDSSNVERKSMERISCIFLRIVK